MRSGSTAHSGYTVEPQHSFDGRHRPETVRPSNQCPTLTQPCRGFVLRRRWKGETHRKSVKGVASLPRSMRPARSQGQTHYTCVMICRA